MILEFFFVSIKLVYSICLCKVKRMCKGLVEEDVEGENLFCGWINIKF